MFPPALTAAPISSAAGSAGSSKTSVRVLIRPGLAQLGLVEVAGCDPHRWRAHSMRRLDVVRRIADHERLLGLERLAEQGRGALERPTRQSHPIRGVRAVAAEAEVVVEVRPGQLD